MKTIIMNPGPETKTTIDDSQTERVTITYGAENWATIKKKH